ncbi:MAG: energy transducer TonB [Litorimonas sp.]
MRIAFPLIAVVLISGCGSTTTFRPKSEYPPDPYVKGYAEAEDCIGGEALAALSLDEPDYPRRAFRTGRQGWVLLRLDVAPDGSIATVEAERAVPKGLFENSAIRAAESWRFEPPQGGALTDCRVLVRYRLGAVSLGG